MPEEIEVFEGIYREQMPLLVSEGFEPATAEKVIEKRFDGKLSFDIYYDTSTGIFYAGNSLDKFKILPCSKDLAEADKNTLLFKGGVEKTEEQYELEDLREFTRKDMILRRDLSEQQALNHVGWLATLNGNKNLLGRLVEHVFRQVKDKLKEDKAMSFYLRDIRGKPNIRPLCLLDLLLRHDGRGRANVYDDNDLGFGYARLVGVSGSAEDKARNLQD